MLETLERNPVRPEPRELEQAWKERRQQPAAGDFGYGGKVCTLCSTEKENTQGLNKVSPVAAGRMNCQGTKVKAERLAQGIKPMKVHTHTHVELDTGTVYGKTLYLLLNFAMNLKLL